MTTAAFGGLGTYALDQHIFLVIPRVIHTSNSYLVGEVEDGSMMLFPGLLISQYLLVTIAIPGH